MSSRFVMGDIVSQPISVNALVDVSLLALQQNSSGKEKSSTFRSPSIPICLSTSFEPGDSTHPIDASIPPTNIYASGQTS